MHIHFFFCRVILNEVKNLNTLTCAFQILRDAQDDTLMGIFYFDTPPFSCFVILNEVKDL